MTDQRSDRYAKVAIDIPPAPAPGLFGWRDDVRAIISVLGLEPPLERTAARLTAWIRRHPRLKRLLSR